jgi:hypothetical protein
MNRKPSVLNDFSDPVIDLHEFARQRGLSRRALARWAATPAAAARLSELVVLADRRAALLLATGRAEAARTLVEIARGNDSERREITRKACLDLLKLNERDPGADAPAPHAESPLLRRPPTEAELDAAARALERYAEERDAEPPTA